MPCGRAILSVAVDRAEQDEDEDREEEGEERELAAAPVERAARRGAGAGSSLTRLRRLVGQLEVDLFERRPAHLEALQLDAARERLGRQLVQDARRLRRLDDDLARRRGGSGSRSRRVAPRQLGRPAEGDDLPVAEHGDPVGELLGLVEVVRREQDRLARARAASGSSPTPRGARPGRSRSSARRGRRARGRRRARAPRSSRRFWPPESVLTRASRFSPSPTRSITSSTSRGRS